MNILVCEDDKDIQDLLAIVLESMDLNMIQSSNKKTLFENLEKEKVDLIIIDYWLKKHKSDDILTRLKSDFDNIPVILMSAIADLEEIANTFKVDDFIKKPFNISDLQNKISTLLNL